jgi:predicted metalloprotease
MRLDDEDESSNIEDRRGDGGGIGVGHIGIGGVAVALIASYFLGIDPRALLGLMETVQSPAQHSTAPSGRPYDTQLHRSPDPANDPDHARKVEVAKVLKKTERTWSALFQQMGGQYVDPTLVLFRGATPTACGTGRAAMGPFYCPGDRKVYLDMSFFDELSQRFHAAGEFAHAYVIAHEIGHHVQNLLGVTRKTDALRVKMSDTQYNKVSVRVELQADCLAGVWAYHANREKPFMEPGDIEKALQAATAIGDDALQRQARGVVIPDSFTHGSSAQRVAWLRRGFESGDLRACDTFAAGDL